MKRSRVALIATAIVAVGLPVAVANMASAQDAQTVVCYEQVEQTRYKQILPSMYWTVEHKEIQWPSGQQNRNAIATWLGISVGTAGEWVQLPDVIVNSAGINPFNVLPTGDVNLSAYGGPNVTVNYRITAIEVHDTPPGELFQQGPFPGANKTLYYTGGVASQTETDAIYTAVNPGDNWVPFGEPQLGNGNEIPCPTTTTTEVTTTTVVTTTTEPFVPTYDLTAVCTSVNAETGQGSAWITNDANQGVTVNGILIAAGTSLDVAATGNPAVLSIVWDDGVEDSIEVDGDCTYTPPTTTVPPTVPPTDPPVTTVPETTPQGRFLPICHLNEDGSYTEMQVLETLIDAHREHGDIYPVPEDGCPVATTTTVPPPDICTTDFPGSGSVANWITSNGYNNADHCFDYEVAQECSTATGSVTLQVEPQYDAGPFRLVWNEGDGIADPYGPSNFPAVFPEDYNGGSVTISYYIVGPENDWFINSALPNYWGGIYGTLVVDTDCMDPVTTTEAPTTTTEPTTTAPPTTIAPTTVAPSPLDIAAITPVCQNDAPFIDVTYGDFPEYNGLPTAVSFIHDGVVIEVQIGTFDANGTERFVYPGASVDADGNPTDWPGWAFDGVNWVEDPTDAFLRDSLLVEVAVNPTASATVSYPPATPECNAAPPQTPPPFEGELPATK